MNLFSRLSLLLLILLPLAACAADKKAPPVEGEDYVLIDGGQPYAPLAGKVEVAEVFGYTCPHCAHFEPTLEAWTAKQPAYVRVTPVPAAFGGFWDAFARAYFAADTLGVAKRSHRAMFDAIHEKHTVPTQNVAPEERGLLRRLRCAAATFHRHAQERGGGRQGQGRARICNARQDPRHAGPGGQRALSDHRA